MDNQIAHFEMVAPTARRLEALHSFRAALSAPGPLDVRGNVFREAQALASRIDRGGNGDSELQPRELDLEIDSRTFARAEDLSELIDAGLGVRTLGEVERLRAELSDLHALRIREIGRAHV